MNILPQTPVLVGAGLFTNREDDPAGAPSPLGLMERAARAAAEDSGAGRKLLTQLDTIAVIRLFADSSSFFACPFGVPENPPASLAKRLGAAPDLLIYPQTGGSTPQWMINELAEAIADGEVDCALIAGGEAQRTQSRAQRMGLELDWRDPCDARPDEPGDPRVGFTPHELAHGLAPPTTVYPLFETALMHRYGHTPEQHLRHMGKLFAPMTEVAAGNAFAALPVARSAENLIDSSDENRFISYPYTKYLNSNLNVDMASAVILTSIGKARGLGIPEDRWVFLHGSADTTEKWFLSERVAYDSAPALGIGARQALEMAGLTIDEIGHFDLYSCFPSAVEIACDEIGLAHDDPRGVTVTGGLPYFGGPGNAYGVLAAAQMMQTLRADPGSYGLVTGNSWYLSRHSFGVYSTTPPRAPWRRPDSAGCQREIDRLGSPPFTETPNGAGRVETYTVLFDRSGPATATVIGRLNESGARFLARINEPKALTKLMAQDCVGRPIMVSSGQGNTAKLMAC